jgi:hypothetical protein
MTFTEKNPDVRRVFVTTKDRAPAYYHTDTRCHLLCYGSDSAEGDEMAQAFVYERSVQKALDSGYIACWLCCDRKVSLCNK